MGVTIVVLATLLGWWLSAPAYSPLIRRKRYTLTAIGIMRVLRGER